MTEVVTYTVDQDGICTLTMDVPGEKVNVLSGALTNGIRINVTRAVADPAVKGIILKSGKDTFVAGGDLKALGRRDQGPNLPPGEKAEQYRTLSRIIREIETCGKPVACIINGFALGGGLEIALGCHYRVVVDDPKAQLGLPEATVGLMPGGGGTQRVLRMVGLKATLPLVMEGKSLTPSEALKIGLIDAMIPADQADAEARRWLKEVGDPVKPWDKKGFKIPGGGTSIDRDFRNTFSGVIPMTRANGYGNYPAPEKILATLYEGGAVPFDTALGIEAKYFTQLMMDPVAGNLIRTMFINKGKADALINRPKGIDKVQYSKIGIIGAGTMGAGIAFSAARAGIEVVLIDRDQEAAERGKDYTRKKLDRDIEKGRSTREKADRILARIHPTIDYAGLSDVQLAIETVFEDRQVKAQVLPAIAAAVPANALIASNTSALPITQLAEYLEEADRFIGMHFFSPVDRMTLVELIRGKKTSDKSWAQALDFVSAIRKTPITVNDSPGFFTSRFIGSFVGTSIDMANEGVKPALIENGARMVGMPMGALTISDSMGLDLAHKASEARARDDGREFIPSLVSKLYLQGRHGIKNGKGFFDYSESGKRLWPGLSELVPTLATQPDIEEVKKRILYAQLAEGARCFAEGVLIDVIDGDLGACLGVGFPAYLGGPFAAMDTIGIPQVVAELDRLAGLYGKMYIAPQVLRDMAAQGQTFHGETAATPPPMAKAA